MIRIASKRMEDRGVSRYDWCKDHVGEESRILIKPRRWARESPLDKTRILNQTIMTADYIFNNKSDAMWFWMVW